MPANFTENEKRAITEKLYEKGHQLLRKCGLKKMKISDLTHSCGIGIGTFYNFFSGKEDFVMKLIRRQRQNMLNAFDALAKENPEGIPFAAAYSFFLRNLLENDIYRLLTQAEYNHLLHKIPFKDNTLEVAKHVMPRLATHKGIRDFLLFGECYKIIIIGSSDLSKLNKETLADALAPLVEAACKILY